MGINGVIWRLPLRGDDIKQNGTLAAGGRPDKAAISNRRVVKTAYFRARSERRIRATYPSVAETSGFDWWEK
jgi:hypothetical protein